MQIQQEDGDVEYAPSSRWRPEALSLFRWWKDHHPARRADFDPTDWASILAGIWMLDVQPDPIRFRFRLVGTSITTRLGRDPTGLWLDEAMSYITPESEFMTRYRRCSEERIAIWKIGRAVLRRDNPLFAVETLILPLVGPDQDTTIILAHTCFHDRRL